MNFIPTPTPRSNINVHGNCKGCPFRTATCGSRGPVNSPWAIVGESPGAEEIKGGVPFIGVSGELLETAKEKVFKLLGVPVVEPYITNALSCHPGKKDVHILAKATAACTWRLNTELKAHPRKVILALGNSALWSTTDDFGLKITQSRGRVYQSGLTSRGVVAAVHPAYLLRGGGSYQKWLRDIELAVRLLTDQPAKRYVDSKHMVFSSTDQIREVTDHLRWRARRRLRPTILAMDTETSGFHPLDDDVLCFGLGWEFHRNYVIPEALSLTPEVKELLNLPPEIVRYVWHNGKFDYGFTSHPRRGLGGRIDEDTMLMSYGLDEVRGQHDLEQVSHDAVGAPNWKAMLDNYLPSKRSSYRDIPRPILHTYLGKDIAATLQSWYVLNPMVRRDKHTSKLYYRTFIPLSPFLAEVEAVGLPVDFEQVEKNAIRLKAEMQLYTSKLNAMALPRMGRAINPNAPAQVAELLYVALKIPTYRGSHSTDADHLEQLPDHPAIRALKAYRKAAKAYSTYVKPLQERKEVQSDNAVHCTYLLHGTVTGRLSSRKPNLQNIPRDPELRSQYVARPGYRLVECDLNQAELRCLAVLSGCPDLMAIYLDPDHPGLHHETSIALFGPNYDDEDKMRAKAVNFGIVYGRTGKSIAEEYHTSAAEGDRWVSGWANRFPVAWKFIQRCRNAPLRKETLITTFGTKRRFPVVSRQNLTDVQNQAANFPHQSTASMLCLHASRKAKYDPRITELGSQFCNLVHDSNLAHVPDDDEIVKEHIRITCGYMESEAPLWNLKAVPFVADAKHGKRWGHLQKVKKAWWALQ